MEYKLNITAAQAQQYHISEMSEANINWLLDDIEKQIRKEAVLYDTLVITKVNGYAKHVHYQVYTGCSLHLSAVSELLVEILKKHGFEAEFKSDGPVWDNSSNDECYQTNYQYYNLVVSWPRKGKI